MPRLSSSIRRFATLAALIALVGCTEKPAPDGQQQTCLPTYQIDHTQIVDKSTILFHMRDGHVWKNTLPQPCGGLMTSDGFAYEPRADQLCDNLEHIHVLRTGSVCMLGAFSPVTPSAK